MNNRNRVPSVMMNNMPPEKSMLGGKVIQSQSREIVANVFAFMKREAELGPQIPFRCVTKRVIAATGVSERTIRRIQREAEIVFSGQAASFVSPRQKKKREKKSSGSGEEENNSVKTEKLEPGSPKQNKMLYPSLEDMKVDQMAKAQQRYATTSPYLQHHMDPRPIPTSNPQCLYPSLSPPPMYSAIEHAHSDIQSVSDASLPYPILPSAPPQMMSTPKSSSMSLYPSLGEFMGLEFSEELVAQNIPDYRVAVPASMDMAVTMSVPSSTIGGMIAPLSGQSPGLQRAHVTNGIRELTVCKGADGKVGLRVQSVNNGIFVCVVVKDSPAALVGLRFGDQILQVNGICVAGYNMDQVHKIFHDSPINGISVVVRDRPFERTVTLHKNSTGHVGFNFKNGKIIGIVADSSAARNGLLTNHHILEVNGQNMVGVNDKEITRCIEEAGPSVTVTIIPSFVFEHMIKKMSSNLIKNAMDHSIPSI